LNLSTRPANKSASKESREDVKCRNFVLYFFVFKVRSKCMFQYCLIISLIQRFLYTLTSLNNIAICNKTGSNTQCVIILSHDITAASETSTKALSQQKKTQPSSELAKSSRLHSIAAPQYQAPLQPFSFIKTIVLSRSQSQLLFDAPCIVQYSLYQGPKLEPQRKLLSRRFIPLLKI
jgi:hypothetical protein